MKYILLVALLISSFHGVQVAAEPSMIIYTLPVRHRTPESMVGALSPLVDPGGQISISGNKFIIRTSAENFQELVHLVEELDTPAVQLLISVRQQSQQGTQDRGLTTQGAITRGKVTLDGKPVTRDSQISVKRSTGWGTRESSYQLRALEGEPVQLQTGQQIPIQTRYGVLGGSTTQYHPVESGISFVVRVLGDQVLLNVTQQQQRPVADNRIETQALHTQVRGRLGEWISLAGVQRQSYQDSRGIIHYQTTDNSLDTNISVKIDTF